MITIIREPENQTLTFDRLNTVCQLLNKLGERSTSVLVIRNGNELLTPDRPLFNGETIVVRGVRSKG
jgi:sulfur carrier protein ThiS